MKTNTILPDLFKAIGFNIKDPNSGFFVFYGLLAGIALNDIWRILHLPGEGVPIVFAGQAQTWETDYVYQMILAGIIALSSMFGVKYAFGFGTGMMAGSTMANQTESGDALSLLPFGVEPKA